MNKRPRYGVGEQSFEVMRTRDCVYVDKTMFIEQLVESGGQYYFLGRPRRFGKSLFLSTLKCFFEGKRQLFKGLYADTMEWDWESYPVLYLDLNIEKYQDSRDLYEVVNNLLIEWERKYDVRKSTDILSIRLNNVIKGVYENTGKRAVILVDEYDKPLVSNLHGKELFEYYRNELAALYSNFKSSADYIRLVFLTGVSRFAHLSVFSGLNNIRDISFDDNFSDICGITERELRESFSEGIADLAAKFNRTDDETLYDLKSRYDGYRFSAEGKDMYNPYSIVNVMESQQFRNYWISSGQATLLWEQLRRSDADLLEVVNTECDIETLAGLDFDNPDPVALLYQTGYLTIKDFDMDFNTVTLGLPNKEVTEGFMNFLLPRYVNLHNEQSSVYIKNFVLDLRRGKIEDFMTRLKSFFAGISYEMRVDEERNFHNAFLVFIKLIGVYSEAEYHTSEGRIDLFIKTDRYYYIIELKLDGSAEEALRQINGKEYALPFSIENREIIKVGVNFSKNTRTISDWLCERD